MEKEVNYWNEYIHWRINSNKNFLCAIIGPTGSGKSYSALRKAQDIDKSFNVDRIVFTPQELLKLLSSDLKPGSVIVVDEAGIVQYSRNWQSQVNKLLNYILQSFRTKRLIVFFCTPSFGFFDSHAKILFHALWITKRIDFKGKKVILEPKIIQVNTVSGKMYFKYMRAPGKWGFKALNALWIGKPSPKLIEAYEKKKDGFLNDMIKDIRERLPDNKELTPRERDFIDVCNKFESVEERKKELGIKGTQYYRLLDAVRGKGVQL